MKDVILEFKKIMIVQGKQISEGSFQSNKRVGEWKYFTKDSVYSIAY